MGMKTILLGFLLAVAAEASFIYGPGIFVTPAETYGHGFWPDVLIGTRLNTFGMSFTLTAQLNAGTTITIAGTHATFDTGAGPTCGVTQGGTAVAGFNFAYTDSQHMTVTGGPALPVANGQVVITCTAGLLQQTGPDQKRVTFTIVTNQAGGTDAVVPNSPGWIMKDGIANPGAPTCFPGEATVDLQPLATYDSSLGFLHAQQGPSSFLTLEHEHGQLRTSANHLVFNGEGRAIPAERLQLGDELILATGVHSRVISICQDTTKHGMFAPLTPSGTVMVDGTMASNYATVGKLNIPHGAMHATFTLSRMFSFLQATSSDDRFETINPLAYVIHDILKLDKLL